jgi:NTP pyrophosphatase (non-canonical NTP hydrolase)
MNKMELLRQANNARHKVWPGSTAGAVAVDFSTIELAGEIGEFLEAVNNCIYVGETGELNDALDAALDALKDEIGDVIISMDILARDLDIDLSDLEGRTKPFITDEYDETATFMFAVVAVGSTAATICDSVKKMMRIQRGIAGNKPGVTEEGLRAKIKEGMQDLLDWLNTVGHVADINIEGCVARKFNRTSKKNNVGCYMDPDTWVWFYSTAMPKENN